MVSLVVSVLVAVPIGVSTFEVDSDLVVDVSAGLLASTFTLVEDDGAGAVAGLAAGA